MLLFENVTDFFQELLVVGVIRSWTPSHFEVILIHSLKIKMQSVKSRSRVEKNFDTCTSRRFFHKTEFDCETLLAKKLNKKTQV